MITSMKVLLHKNTDTRKNFRNKKNSVYKTPMWSLILLFQKIKDFLERL